MIVLIRRVLRASGNSAEAQYQVFAYLLSKVTAGPVFLSLANLAAKLEAKLKQLSEDAVA